LFSHFLFIALMRTVVRLGPEGFNIFRATNQINRSESNDLWDRILAYNKLFLLFSDSSSHAVEVSFRNLQIRTC
jgi:hypothetical protein